MTKKKKAVKTKSKQPTTTNRRVFLLGGIAAGVAGIAWTLMPGKSMAGEIVVYKSQYCGCCGKWADRMRRHGYSITIRDTEEMDDVKQRIGVPEDLHSCHTATIDGYVIEGHVPAREVNRLLSERPKAKGISVPGMPTGSPGMEGGEPESYKVVLFDSKGNRQVYAKY